MVRIFYFAWLRERLGMGEEDIKLPNDVTTINALFDWLETRGEAFEAIMESREILQVALDKKHTQDRDAIITGVTEIAIFPPMTGG